MKINLRLPMALIAFGLAAMPAVVIANVAIVVATNSGKVKGAQSEGVVSWKGIPFAASPTGPFRWRAPQPVTHWTNVRDATSYQHDCMQVPLDGDAAPLGTPPAEDCLYLNVWRQSRAAKKLPVIFWIYGGGFVNGGASPPTYAGANLARQGVIFVSANYRVGRFGTFAHPQLTAKDADKGLLCNYGFLDQIAALNWVKRNIAAFGGDPDNVTIIGESAGGASVHVLTTSPLARGLFAKAVVMSGMNGYLGDNPLGEVEKIGMAFAASKGIAADDPQAITKLRSLSADDVTSGLNMMALFDDTGPRTFSSPLVDGRIAVSPADSYAKGAFPHIPMIIGATDDDIGGKTGPMVAGARHVSAVIGDQRARVWEYRFSYVAQHLGKTGAGHATDVPFFLNTQVVKYGERTTPRDNAMGATISAYLVNFAKTGNPNRAGLPVWPGYTPGTDRIMDFTAEGTAVVKKDPWDAEIKAAPRDMRL